MGVSVKVDYDNLPEGAEVEIPYLGLFENGSSREVEDERWERFLDLQPGAREQYEGETSVEFSTAAAQRLSEAHADLAEAATSEEKPLSEYKKSQLKDMADAAGVATEGLNKDELVKALESSVGGQTIPNESQEG